MIAERSRADSNLYDAGVRRAGDYAPDTTRRKAGSPIIRPRIILSQFRLLLSGYRLIGIDIGAVPDLLFCDPDREYPGFPSASWQETSLIKNGLFLKNRECNCK